MGERDQASFVYGFRLCAKLILESDCKITMIYVIICKRNRRGSFLASSLRYMVYRSALMMQCGHYSDMHTRRVCYGKTRGH